MSETTTPVALDTRVTLYMGCAIPVQHQASVGLAAVDDTALDAFEAEFISRAFADGYTLEIMRGGWRDTLTGQMIRERTVLVSACINRATQDAQVVHLANAWKTLYCQDAVLVTYDAVQASFI